jgi:hypothetical protein
MMGRGKKMTMEPVVEVVVDPTGWLLANSIAEFILMHTAEIKYMCMFGYAFYHGMSVQFVSFQRSLSISFGSPPRS